MKLASVFRSMGHKLANIPLKYSIILVSTFLVGVYSLVMLIPKSVQFSYAGKTCTNWPVLLPENYKTVGGNGYVAYPSDLIKIGKFPVLATSVCFAPLSAPGEGKKQVGLAPFGVGLLVKRFEIKVNTPPKAIISFTKPIPITKPLTLPLSDTDRVFTYSLRVANKKVTCKPQEKKVACDLGPLQLSQGSQYKIEITRYFGTQKIGRPDQKDIVTLPATRVIQSSIKNNEIVYSRSKTIDVTFDKKITKAKVLLTKVENSKSVELKTTVKLDGAVLHATTENELPRSTSYTLAISGVEAEDGSGLEATYTLPFSMSGGPKVTSINIGRSSVALGTKAIITFDQALSEKQDINKVLTLTGGATVAGKEGNKVYVSLAQIPKCGDFLIKISDELLSNYDIKGGSAWTYASRMICHATGVIGYSSKGRPITAFYFGDGPASILYTGAIHGNEVSTKLLMDRWISDLEVKAKSIPAGKSVVVIPQVNPDGVLAGTRVNARNVDLNRNFATGDWKKDITTVNNQPFPGGGGESAMSEPETRALAGFVSRLRPALVLSYHSVGGLLAANQAGNSISLAAKYSSLSGYRNTTGQTGETFEYSISGTADDWYAESLGVASILIELGSTNYSQFDRNQTAMWAMINS